MYVTSKNFDKLASLSNICKNLIIRIDDDDEQNKIKECQINDLSITESLTIYDEITEYNILV